jgi:hypothetical protein
VERNHDGFAARTGLFHHRVGYTLCDLSLLIGRAALDHSDLN